jgi:hypothetical protein
MVVKATEFETLRVLHTLWKNKDLDTLQVKNCLWEAYRLLLTVLANGEISAQSVDGKQKYKINQ